jgi:hypothetical protein
VEVVGLAAKLLLDSCRVAKLGGLLLLSLWFSVSCTAVCLYKPTAVGLGGRLFGPAACCTRLATILQGA